MPLRVKCLARLNGIKAIICGMHFAHGQLIMTSLTKQFIASQIILLWNLLNMNGCEFSIWWYSHWKIPLYICNVKLYVALS